jgi:hypothetical protein
MNQTFVISEKASPETEHVDPEVTIAASVLDEEYLTSSFESACFALGLKVKVLKDKRVLGEQLHEMAPDEIYFLIDCANSAACKTSIEEAGLYLNFAEKLSKYV